MQLMAEEVEESFYEMDDGRRDGAISNTTGSLLTLPGTMKKQLVACAGPDQETAFSFWKDLVLG